MAQWSGQFSGLTHETKIQDIENSLRLAIHSYQTAAEEVDRAGKLKNIRHLARRLLQARLKALRARISALTEPGPQSLDQTKAAHLRTREQQLESQDVDDILNEFGI